VPSAYHEGCGFAVFVVGLGLECLFGYALLAWDRRRRGVTSSAKAAEAPGVGALGTFPVYRGTLVAGLAVAILIVELLSPPIYLPSEPGVVMDLPDEVKLSGIDGGHFYGSVAQVSDAEHRMLPKDTEYARKNYDDFHDHQIFFSIVLSGLQQYTIHPPEVCLTAQGWNIVKSEDFPVRLDSGHPFTVRKLTIERNDLGQDGVLRLHRAYYMFWYVTDGITTASHLERNLRSSWDRIIHSRDHRWAYVIAMAEITGTPQDSGGMDADQTQQMLAAFIRQIVPTFQKSEIPSYTANR
jgi:EpsI family protein